MKKCCEKCALYKVNDHVGRCSWAPTNPPFWFVVWPTLVEADEGANCLAFDDDSHDHANPGWSDPLQADKAP